MRNIYRDDNITDYVIDHTDDVDFIQTMQELNNICF